MRRIGATLLAALAVLLSLAGCGGGSAGTTTGSSQDAEAPARATTVAALGDSITAGSPLWDPDPAVRRQIGSALDRESSFEYWAAEADPSLSFRNCGVFGERTDQIALRLDTCASGTDLLIVQGGINDIAQGIPVEAAAGNLRGMVRAGLDAGLEVAIADVLPWNNGHPAADGPIGELNGQIAAIAEEEGVPLLPFHATLEDPAEPGTMSPRLTVDGDHPSVAGYRLLAEQAVLPNLP